MRWLRRLYCWLNRRRIDDGLREEMETHRAMREAAMAKRGEADPAAASRRSLGNLALARDDARDVWIWPWLDGLIRDAKFTLRWMRRRPGFAATCVATIAIGTGALASVLSVVHVVLLGPPPYPNQARLVQIAQVSRNTGRLLDEVSAADVLALRQHGGAIENVTTAWTSSVSLSGGSLPERARMVFTDSRAFAMLGAPPAIGRLPSLADEAPDAPPVVMLGHTLWAQQFASDRSVLGRPLKIDGRTYTMIGVMPPGFRFPAPYWSDGDLWLLRGAADASWPATREGNLLAFALIAEGETVERAQQEADAAAASLDARFPAAGQIGLRLVPYGHTVRSDARPRLLLILGAAVLVLLIVCVNVVNLMLGRSLERHREMAARAALGAGRGRLGRQLITETVVLFTAGGISGVLLAVWGSRAIVAMSSFSIPRMDEAAVNGPVAGLALGTVLIAALIVGMVIALQATSRRRLGLDAAGARGASEGRRWRGLQRMLVAAEVALAFVLLCGAGVLVEGARAQAHITAGFDASTIVHARLTLPRDKYADARSQRQMLTRIVEALAAIPGVRQAGVVDVPPGVGGSNARALSLDTDSPAATGRDLRQVNVRIADARYFETLGLTARAGRLLRPEDDDAANVVVVNEAFVAAHLGGASAIGRQIRVVPRGATATVTPLRTIIGVYPNIKEKTIYEPTPPTVYLPLDARDATRMAVLVRTDRPVGEITQAMRAAIASVDPEQAAFGFITLGDLISSELSLNALSLRLVGSLGTVALLLAVIGVYGVMAQAVRQRTREIAIRLALGVTPTAVTRLLLRECSLLVAGAFLAGGGAAIWAAAILRSQMLGIKSTSPLTFAAAAALLAVAVLAGCYVPARRAARTDPALVLRAE